MTDRQTHRKTVTYSALMVKTLTRCVPTRATRGTDFLGIRPRDTALSQVPLACGWEKKQLVRVSSLEGQHRLFLILSGILCKHAVYLDMPLRLNDIKQKTFQETVFTLIILLGH